MRVGKANGERPAHRGGCGRSLVLDDGGGRRLTDGDQQRQQESDRQQRPAACCDGSSSPPASAPTEAAGVVPAVGAAITAPLSLVSRPGTAECNARPPTGNVAPTAAAAVASEGNQQVAEVPPESASGSAATSCKGDDAGAAVAAVAAVPGVALPLGMHQAAEAVAAAPMAEEEATTAAASAPLPLHRQQRPPLTPSGAAARLAAHALRPVAAANGHRAASPARPPWVQAGAHAPPPQPAASALLAGCSLTAAAAPHWTPVPNPFVLALAPLVIQAEPSAQAEGAARGSGAPSVDGCLSREPSHAGVRQRQATSERGGWRAGVRQHALAGRALRDIPELAKIASRVRDACVQPAFTVSKRSLSDGSLLPAWITQQSPTPSPQET
jgi:hypothetical protein